MRLSSFSQSQYSYNVAMYSHLLMISLYIRAITLRFLEFLTSDFGTITLWIIFAGILIVMLLIDKRTSVMLYYVVCVLIMTLCFPITLIYLAIMFNNYRTGSSRDHIADNNTAQTRLIKMSTKEAYELSDEPACICYRRVYANKKDNLTCSICLESLEVDEEFREELKSNISEEAKMYYDIEETNFGTDDQETKLLKIRRHHSKGLQIGIIAEDSAFANSKKWSQMLRRKSEPYDLDIQQSFSDKFSGNIILKNDTCLTSCGHYFHYGCFQLWHHKKGECPQCRHTISLLECRIIYRADLNINRTEDKQNLEVYMIKKLKINQFEDLF